MQQVLTFGRGFSLAKMGRKRGGMKKKNKRKENEVAETGEWKLERDVLNGISGMSPWSLSHACFLTVTGFNHL